MEFIDQILSWNVIIQGTLGSALFWLISVILKILFGFLSNIFSKFSSNIKLESKTAEWVHLNYQVSDQCSDSGIYLTWCIYHGLSHITQAFIWLVMGSFLGEYIPTFSFVGYLGALYYLYRATNVLPLEDAYELTEEGDRLRQDKIEMLNKELDEKTPNKSIKQD
jgi:hypothetical protein